MRRRIRTLPTSSLPHSPVTELRAAKSCGEAKEEGKDITRFNNWARQRSLAKGHSWPGGACFDAEPKHEAWKLHLAHPTQHSPCQSCTTNPREPRGLARESTAFWLSGWSGKVLLARPQPRRQRKGCWVLG